MAPDRRQDLLVAELTALGRAVPEPRLDTPALADAVLSRLGEPLPAQPLAIKESLTPRGSPWITWRRIALVIGTAILLALLGSPAVRAEVADWFRFAGVIVRVDPSRGSAAPSATPGRATTPSSPFTSPATVRSPELDRARRFVRFTPVVPTALGPPQDVEVSPDRRVLTLIWTRPGEGTIRLDQFDAHLDYVFAKTVPGVEYTEVGNSFALWFDEPHEVVLLEPDGTRRTETARLAGHTLIWEDGGTVLRLEGDLTFDRARQIALSAG